MWGAEGKAYRVGIGFGLHGSQQRLQTRVKFERFDRHLEKVIDGTNGGRNLEAAALRTGEDEEKQR